MRSIRRISRFGLIVALALPLPALVACGGGSKGSAGHALPKAGDMPEGSEWTGVYFSPTYGYLHLVKEGSAISGKWRNAAGDKWGMMHGEATGNLFKFEWQETKIGLVGPSATTRGLGYFVYTKDTEKEQIKGEWGLGSEQTGVTWDAIKQRNMKPDPDSVVPDETQKVEGGGWDDEGKKKKSGGGEGGGDKSDEWN